MLQEDIEELRRAVEALEHPSLTARLSSMIGKPIELVQRALPAGASEAISGATAKGLNAALRLALLSMQGETRMLSPQLHKSLAAVSGALGGGFGLVALPLELPVSTVIMLRAIMEIARSQGEDIRDPDTALSCLQVFALGGRAGAGDVLGNG